MTDRILYKVAYNMVNNENWIEDRDSLDQGRYPERSIFLNVDELRKSGRDLYADLEKNGITSVPRKFIELNDIVY